MLAGAGKAAGEQHDRGQSGGEQAGAPRQLLAKQMERPQGDQRIQQAEQEARAHQAEMRRQQQRKEDRDGQRAEVVEGQHARDEFVEGDIALEDAHHQRDFQPDQHADRKHGAVEQHAEGAGIGGEGDEQPGRRKAADQPDRELDLDEGADQIARDELRQPGADAHREQIGADDGGKLGDRVAEQIRGECAGDQLIGEPAGGDDKDRGEQRQLQALAPPGGVIHESRRRR